MGSQQNCNFKPPHQEQSLLFIWFYLSATMVDTCISAAGSGYNKRCIWVC